MADDGLTLELAKRGAIALGNEIAAYFPSQFVTESRTIENARTLLPCSGENRYAWPGRTTLLVSGVGDQAAALEPIAVEWESRGAWDVERLAPSPGRAGIDLKQEDGTDARVSFMLDGTEVWIDVVSPCFTLPGGFDLRGSW